MGNVQKEFPGTELLKTREGDLQEWRVPMPLACSASGLYLRVTVSASFPMIAPGIQILARVTHASVEEGTYNYKGPAIRTWNQNS